MSSTKTLPFALALGTGLCLILALLLGQQVVGASVSPDPAAPATLQGPSAQSPQPAAEAADSGDSMAATSGPASAWAPPDPAYKVLVTADGMYKLDYAYLQAAGLPVDSLDPRTFRMFYRGQEIAIRVLGEEDGRLDPGDLVLFYGRGVDSLYYEGLLPTNKYTGTNVYWLSYGGAAGLRMSTRDGGVTGDPVGPFLTTTHLERNVWYWSRYPFQHNADHWYWEWLQASGTSVPYTKTYSFTARNIASGALTGSLSVSLLGYGEGAHHVRLYVNDNLVLDDNTSWWAFDLFNRTVDVPQSYFREGSNSIKVVLLNDPGKTYDKQYTNWLEVRYYDTYVAESNRLLFGNDNPGTWRYQVTNFDTPDAEVYDVSDLAAVQRIINTTVSAAAPYSIGFGDSVTTGRRYLALTPATWAQPAGFMAASHRTSAFTPADLLSATNRADYIIVSHGDFWDQALWLATYRALRYRVALVDAQQIYDQFNGGMMSAESIHDFLAYAREHWQPPAPLYVVLLGDGTNDMRNYKGSSAPTYIPPYLYLADPDLGETAADNRFVTLVGDDNMPDMHIGRLPANSEAEAQAMVDKIINYETACQCGSWNYNTLFVTDDLEGGGGNFYTYSDMVADGYADPPTNTIKFVPPVYDITKLYMGQTCDLGNPASSVECRYQITHTLNVTGALFVSYVGHSTTKIWAPDEKLFDEAAVATLTNGPCLPVMLPMTCYEGSFHEPASGFSALSEAAVRRVTSGAIASWSPTGFGLVSGHDYLEKGLLLALLNDGVSELGAATTAGKRYLLDNAPAGKYTDLLDTFVLLGDPALRVKTDSVCTVPTGVRMRDFGVKALGASVQVHWETASEADVLGFNVLRSQRGDAPSPAPADFSPVNGSLIFAARSGANAGEAYSYRDTGTRLGATYVYALEIVHLDGSRERYGLAEVTVTGWRQFLPRLSAGTR